MPYRRTFAAGAEGGSPEFPEAPEGAGSVRRNFRRLRRGAAADMGLGSMSHFCSKYKFWYLIWCQSDDQFPELPERSGTKQSYNPRSLAGVQAIRYRYFRKSGGFDPVVISRSSSVANE